MLITYTPHDGEAREWTFRPLDITSREAELVEDYLGLTFDGWSARFYAGSAKARRAALWLLLRREDPTLGLEDVDYRMTELRAAWEGSENAELRRHIQDDPDLSDADRAKLLARLPEDDPADDNGEGESGEGKGTAPAGDAGSGASPTS